MYRLTEHPNSPKPSSLPATVLGDHGVASVTIGIEWIDDRAHHENYLHVERFSVFREADSLPHEMAGAIAGMAQGERVSTSEADTFDIEAWNKNQRRLVSPSDFDRHHRRGLMVEPSLGRFYPQGFFHRIPEILEDGVTPVRITDLTPERISIDLNHPMARYPFRVQLQVDEILPGYHLRGGRCLNPLSELLQFPGLAAPLAGGTLTDFGDHTKGKGRMDVSDDSRFYQKPRMVQHLDRQALMLLNDLYRRLIPKDAVVLDLMASHDSHLQGIELAGLRLLGMNPEELAANSAGSDYVVHDLNREPTLPYAEDSLDVIVCTASVEYLIYPEAILAEVKRVLRPGGLFVASFSNRWFPTKAIRIWSDLHEFERVGMLTQWLQQAGFGKLSTYSAKGWPRPSDDPHAKSTAHCDPVYAVWGYKS
jgi:SAM-dependent methyltransferase